MAVQNCYIQHIMLYNVYRNKHLIPLSFVHALSTLKSTCAVLRTASDEHHSHWSDNQASRKLAHGDPKEYVAMAMQHEKLQ